jgi:hypothetical protein
MWVNLDNLGVYMSLSLAHERSADNCACILHDTLILNVSASIYLSLLSEQGGVLHLLVSSITCYLCNSLLSVAKVTFIADRLGQLALHRQKCSDSTRGIFVAYSQCKRPNHVQCFVLVRVSIQ